MNRLPAILALCVSMLSCGPTDETCALLPCATRCLTACSGDAGTAACTTAVSTCQAQFSTDAGPIADAGP